MVDTELFARINVVCTISRLLIFIFAPYLGDELINRTSGSIIKNDSWYTEIDPNFSTEVYGKMRRHCWTTFWHFHLFSNLNVECVIFYNNRSQSREKHLYSDITKVENWKYC